MWKFIPNTKYEVNHHGEVRRIGGTRILKPMRTGSKRPGSQRSKVRLSTKPRVDRDIAHLVLEAFVGPRPPGGFAMHINDDSSDNRLVNLKWGTAKENACDCACKGRSGGQKLSQDDAADIRKLRALGVKGAVVARFFGVSQQRVCDIFKGRTAL